MEKTPMIEPCPIGSQSIVQVVDHPIHLNQNSWYNDVEITESLASLFAYPSFSASSWCSSSKKTMKNSMKLEMLHGQTIHDPIIIMNNPEKNDGDHVCCHGNSTTTTTNICTTSASSSEGQDDDDDDDEIATHDNDEYYDSSVSNHHSTSSSAARSQGDDQLFLYDESRTRNNTTKLQNNFWWARFEELAAFQRINGHCHIPQQTSPTNKQTNTLALWIKRQRHQYRQKQDGKHSTLTQEREDALNSLGFVWGSHETTWEERYNELCMFHEKYGHCNVPGIFNESPHLGIWVKCQRRQYRLIMAGKAKKHATAMNRISRLNNLGFIWNPRKHNREKKQIEIGKIMKQDQP